MEAEMVSNYDDIVTQDDIDFLHNHAEAKFGKPRFVSSTSDWGLERVKNGDGHRHPTPAQPRGGCVP